MLTLTNIFLINLNTISVHLFQFTLMLTKYFLIILHNLRKMCEKHLMTAQIFASAQTSVANEVVLINFVEVIGGLKANRTV